MNGIVPLGYKVDTNDISMWRSSFSNLKMRTNQTRNVISSCNETPNVSSTKPHKSTATTTSRGSEEQNSRVKQVCNKEKIRLKRKHELEEKLKMYKEELADINSNSGKL